MGKPTCTIDGCDSEVRARTWCNAHYKRWRRTGDPLKTIKYTCSVDGCETALYQRRYCYEHYTAARRRGDFDSPNKCTIQGCGKVRKARGYCANHYSKWLTYGDPEASHRWATPLEQLQNRQEWNGECLEFTEHRDKHGYGKMNVKGRGMLAHRLAYELEHGAIPEGMQIDHSCRNPSCTNPAHLRMATQALNMQNQAPDGRRGRSSYRGVYWHNANSKWVAQVRFNGKSHYLGQFLTEGEAHQAARAKRNELYVYNDWDRAA